MPPAETSWIQRNAKWLIPVLLLALAGIVTAVFSVFVGFMKSSEPYRLALARAQASPAVIAVLGTPVDAGFLVLGNIHQTATAGQAQLEIPLRAPRGSGTLYVVAAKAGGAWQFEILIVQPTGSPQRIDLLAK